MFSSFFSACSSHQKSLDFFSPFTEVQAALQTVQGIQWKCHCSWQVFWLLSTVSDFCRAVKCYYRSAVHGTGEWTVLWDVVSEYVYISRICSFLCKSVPSRCAFCVCWKAVFLWEKQESACWTFQRTSECMLTVYKGWWSWVSCFAFLYSLSYVFPSSNTVQVCMRTHGNRHTQIKLSHKSTMHPNFLAVAVSWRKLWNFAVQFSISFWTAIWAQYWHCSELCGLNSFPHMTPPTPPHPPPPHTSFCCFALCTVSAGEN